MTKLCGLLLLASLTTTIAFAQTPADSAKVEQSLVIVRDSLKQLRADINGVRDSIRNEQDRAKAAWKTAYPFTLGASLDLIDGIRASDVYASVQAHRPRILSRSDTATSRYRGLSLLGRRFGLDAGLVRSRGVTADSFDTRRGLVERRNYYDEEADSLIVVSQEYTRSTESTSDYLYMYSSFTHPIHSSFYVVLPHIEVRRSINRTSVNIDADPLVVETYADTVLVNQVGTPTLPLRRYRAGVNLVQSQRLQGTVTDGYFGTGLLFDNTDTPEGVRLRLKGIVGVTGDGLRSKIVLFNRDWFYQLQFDLIEKEFGLRLGGEVFGSFEAGRNGFAEPRISIFLAKSFTLGKVGRFLN